ncbi:hypothetical protein NEMBOFW57_009094 [Staphylotrichum longicolle]|uniref:Protein kinase domain-containing protein n=1 Tax=Staphylotrichum longicolle TaxID=669026 RepID=A0AAD4EWT6_9PEZI|nr:hypothetical protein NEMBOFW57_009094 [Staphylotrichum longicolle]
MASFTEDGDGYASYTCANASDQTAQDVQGLALEPQGPSDGGETAHERQAKAGPPTPTDERLPITFQLMRLVNQAKFSGGIVGAGFGVQDFAALGSQQIARGGYFQTRETDGLGVAKYPVFATASTELSAKSYKALANELRVLSHPPLMAHENIVNINTIGWTRLDPIAPAWIPMIFLELADLGTLTKYLSEKRLEVDSKLDICRDIGAGIQALHACGIIHGDLKMDNILMFKGEDGKVIAKLSDFGCSYILQADQEEDDRAEVEITAGTRPWNSPELNDKVAVSLLRNVDAYSFGLLVWSVFLNGRNPFEGMAEREIDERKTQDLMILDASRSLEEEYEKNAILRGGISSQERFHLYMRGVAMPKRCFRYTLACAVRDRSLGKAIDSLSYEKTYGPIKIGAEFLRLFDIPWTAQIMFLRSVEQIAADETIARERRAKAYLQLCYAHLNSFGTITNFDEGVQCLKTAAKLGSTTAATMLGPVLAATGHAVGAELAASIRQWLVRAVGVGSILARRQLQMLDNDPETMRKAEEDRRLWMGARIPTGKEVAEARYIDMVFFPANLPVMRTFLGVGGEESVFERMGVRQLPVSFLSYEMNTYLHAGAALGVDPDHFRNAISMVDDLDTIDAQDKNGNTALLLAVQFGNVGIAQALLEEGANASRANKRGETPWHWLISLGDEDVSLLSFLMMDDDQGLESVAAARNDTDNEYGVDHGGTPLHWAVEMDRHTLVAKLLECGADPLLRYRGLSAVDLAVVRNANDILDMLLDSIDETDEVIFPLRPLADLIGRHNLSDKDSKITDTLLQQATLFRPTHQLLLYGGSFWRARQKATLQILHERGHLLPWNKDNNQARLETFRMLAFSNATDAEMIEDMMEVAGVFPQIPESNSEGGTNTVVDAARQFWKDALQSVVSGSSRPAMILYTIEQVRRSSPNHRVENADNLLHLYCAAMEADVAVVEELLQDCSSVDCTDGIGRTPLMEAVRNRNFELATYLLKRGADVSRPWLNRYSGEQRVYMPYEYVANNTDVDVVPLKYLLEPMHPFPDKVPPLLIGPDNADSLLHQACRDGNPVIVDYLLSKFASKDLINQPGDNGNTPLHQAAFNGHLDVAAKLCQAGAEVDARSGASNMTNRDRSRPLDLCFQRTTHNPEFLVERFGLERTKEDVYLGRLRIAHLLQRQHGARRADRFFVHRSAAMRLALDAADGGMTRLLREALRSVGKEVDAAGHKDVDFPIIVTNLLWSAAWKGHVTAVQLLLDLGADPNQRSPKGMSLLHHVAWRGLAEVIYVLVKKGGADVNAEDAAGESVATYAARSNNLAAIRMVKRLGGFFTLPRASTARLLGGLELPFRLRFVAKFAGEPSDEDLSGGSERGNESEASKQEAEADDKDQDGSDNDNEPVQAMLGSGGFEGLRKGSENS